MQNFGRIAPETAELIRRLAEQIRTEIVPTIPGGPPAKAEAATTEAVMSVVLRDWSENENTSGLLPADIADINSFIQLAHSVAGAEPYGRGLPIYEAALKGLLEDWLENWNAPGQPGPPHRS